MKLYVRRITCVLALLSLIVALGLPLAAQTSRGTLTGTVTDPTGAVVADANVTITNPATGTSRSTTSNSAGLYRFDAVELGTYNLVVSAKGFGDFKAEGLTVAAARTTNLDAALRVGASTETVTVEGATGQVALQTTEQVRGGNFVGQQITNVPLVGGDSLTLMQQLPGITVNSGITTTFSNGTYNYSVNGQRQRGNNFMIDGVENNDISVGGPAYTITNPNIIQELNIQTSNFSAEFGRAGGAVVNQVIKSGTNSFHGNVEWYYKGNVTDATTNSDRLGGLKHRPRFVENTPDFTAGGPVIIPGLYNGKNKTFWFAAGQWDRVYQTLTSNVRVPTAAGFSVLQALAPNCPNVAIYLKAVGDLRGDPNLSPSTISIAAPAGTTTCNGTLRTGQTVQTGFVTRKASESTPDGNHQIRIDHAASEKQNLSFRWLYDSNTDTPNGFNNLPGFDNIFTGRTMTGSFTDTYVISPSWTNEFRFNYGRINFQFPSGAPDDFHENLPAYTIQGNPVTAWGLATNIPQGRVANNWQYQDTMSKVVGNHQFRFGVDILRQLAAQVPPFNPRGALTFNASTTAAANAFTNFIDDFGGQGGALSRQFGVSRYRPNLFRHSYFVQDSWKLRSDFTLNLGLRYENFGQPANTFAVAAFTFWDPVNFAAPHKVNPDNNNFAPTVGFAWNPHGNGLVGRMFGDGKTVWRGGFQVSYDSFFNNLLSNIAGSSPNLLGGAINSSQSASAGRGTAAFTNSFGSIQPTLPTAASTQQNLFDPDIRNPYSMHYSLGFQRELPANMIMDVSYVGSENRKQFRSLDMNPIVPGSTARLFPQVGIRTMRCSCTNSNYNGLQASVTRRFSTTPIGSVSVTNSYTYSHTLDSVSEAFATINASSVQSVSQLFGPQSGHLDYGNADFDVRHQYKMAFVWDVRGPKTGVLGQILGGWSVTGSPRIQTGGYFTMANGVDRNADGQTGPDRPDIGNPSAPLNTRGVIVATSTCSTGFQNPDNLACVTANDVHWLQGTGLPNAKTVGRNTQQGKGIGVLDTNIIKHFKIREGMDLQYRLEIFNVLNQANYAGVPGVTVNGSSTASFYNFLNLNTAPLGERSRNMRMALKFSW